MTLITNRILIINYNKEAQILNKYIKMNKIKNMEDFN